MANKKSPPKKKIKNVPKLATSGIFYSVGAQGAQTRTLWDVGALHHMMIVFMLVFLFVI